MIQEETEATSRIDIQLQFRSKVPLSDQVRKGIFDLIQRGVLAEDTPLPTVRELAAQLGVNFNTVARAYRALDKEGWLITRQGRGTIVTKPNREASLDPFMEKIQQLAEEVEFAASSLGITPNEIIQALAASFAQKTGQASISRKKRQRKTKARFRAYHPALPRSKRFRKETMDWRLRRPMQS